MKKIEFAPPDVPLPRRLQTAAVLQWVFSFLGLAPCCIVLFFVLLFTRFWLISALYAAWWFIDWDTPSRGGRRLNFLCDLSVWYHMRDYFPVRLVKTADLDPRKNYVFGFHPHGILVAGAFTNFCTLSTGFPSLYPGLTPHLLMLPLWFRAPFFRDYIMFAGLVPSDKDSASYLLQRPEGGKKGFIKLAMEHGAPLVPVFSFGENELFNQVDNPRGTLLRWVQERLQRLMGVSLPLFHARGVFQYSFGLMPFRKPIHTVVGKPIPVQQNEKPTDEELNDLHERYMSELSQLFEEHKGKFGVPEDKHLTFV
ncbi:hypothetical protein ANANG_G00164250 [Anguilla anguilla]|uniref:Acyltransferase n=1 Tax=Anguilla anguilla TaxID=7936 RepID=A0A9D3RVE9_ANGAN|nr:hypothetical protein ANANG_G00164250 [Anguilla anguilla]